MKTRSVTKKENQEKEQQAKRHKEAMSFFTGGGPMPEWAAEEFKRIVLAERQAPPYLPASLRNKK